MSGNVRIDVPDTNFGWYKDVRKMIRKHNVTNFNVGWYPDKQHAYVVGESFLSMYMIFVDLKAALLADSFYECTKEAQTGS